MYSKYGNNFGNIFIIVKMFLSTTLSLDVSATPNSGIPLKNIWILLGNMVILFLKSSGSCVGTAINIIAAMIATNSKKINSTLLTCATFPTNIPHKNEYITTLIVFVIFYRFLKI